MRPEQYRNRGKCGVFGGPNVCARNRPILQLLQPLNVRACITPTIATFSNLETVGAASVETPADAIPPRVGRFPAIFGPFAPLRWNCTPAPYCDEIRAFWRFPCISVFPNLWRPTRPAPLTVKKKKPEPLRAYHRPGDLSEIPIIPTVQRARVKLPLKNPAACFPRVGPCCSICGRFPLWRWNCTNAGRSCEIRPFLEVLAETWRISPIYRRAILRYYSGAGVFPQGRNHRAG